LTKQVGFDSMKETADAIATVLVKEKPLRKTS